MHQKMKGLFLSICHILSCFALVAVTQVSAQTVPAPEIAQIPLDGIDIVTLVYRPVASGPVPVLVFSHGRAGEAADRAKPHIPPNNVLRYWLGKGFAVVAPVRIGYGQTGGPEREDSGTKFKNGVCITTSPDFDKVATNAAQSVTTVLDWLRKQDWADSSKIVLEGQSVGGLTVVKLGSLNLPGVLGYVNFAGGSGGNPISSPTKSCHPELLTETYRRLGTQTHVPSIWFYAENDLYWGPDMPVTWHVAFAAGGSPTQLVHTGPVEGRNGHFLLNYGEKMWVEPLDNFVRSLGFK